MTEIRVERTGEHTFSATNGRGASVAIGRAGAPEAFSPVELLLAAAAGCVAVTGEELIRRRTGAEWVTTAADVRPDGAHELDGVRIDVTGIDDPAIVAVVERAVAALCTVTRTLKRGAAVDLRIGADTMRP